VQRALSVRPGQLSYSERDGKQVVAYMGYTGWRPVRCRCGQWIAAAMAVHSSIISGSCQLISCHFCDCTVLLVATHARSAIASIPDLYLYCMRRVPVFRRLSASNVCWRRAPVDTAVL